MAAASPIRVLMFGDVVGQPGRIALAEWVPKLRKQHRVDCVIANVENLAHGKGITEKTLAELLRAGVDFCTSGNHVLNKHGAAMLEDPSVPVIRPANFPDGTPGRGHARVKVGAHTLLVINLIGTVFFRDGATYANPFLTADAILASKDAKGVNGVIIDWHTEATSEKLALGWYLDGRVSAVFGTHTHIPTDDLRILPHGTAFRADLGMVGLRDEVLGAEKDIIIQNFVHPDASRAHVWTDEGPTQLHGVLLEIDPKTGHATHVSGIDHEGNA